MFRNFIFKLFIFSCWLWLLYNWFHDYIFLNDVHLFYSYVSILFCLYVCSGRFFVMSPSYLDKNIPIHCGLEYSCDRFNDRDHVGRIYVRTTFDFIWRELDYDLCIPRNCSYRCYSDFVGSHGTCELLLDSMNKRYRDDYHRMIYKDSIHNNYYLCGFGILLTLIINLFIWSSYVPF